MALIILNTSGSHHSLVNVDQIKNFYCKKTVIGPYGIEKNPKSVPKKFTRMCTFKSRVYSLHPKLCKELVTQGLDHGFHSC